MTKDDIIKLAREAGWDAHHAAFDTRIEAFYNLVAAHKTDVALAEAYRCGHEAGMEAGAVVCENLPVQQDRDVRDECAAAIRARIDK